MKPEKTGQQVIGVSAFLKTWNVDFVMQLMHDTIVLTDYTRM
jgi:hypothetical protein